MNPYLTEKVEKDKKTRWWLLAICALFAAASFGTIPDFLREANYASASASTVISLLCLLPIIRKVSTLILVRRANTLAVGFWACTEDTITFATLASSSSIKKPHVVLRKLLQAGYIQNITIDMQNNKVQLLAPLQKASVQAYTKVECPHCGAENLVLAGKVNRCKYCDQALISPAKAKRKS